MAGPVEADAYVAAAPAVGRASAVLLLTQRRWMHRRVEAVDVLGSDLVRRAVSVDFTVPPALRELLRVGDGRSVVPLTTLAKGKLRRFDLRDEDAAVVPVLGRRHNALVAGQALAAAARRALRAEALDASLAAALAEVATLDPPEAGAALDELAVTRAGAAVRADPAARFLLETLADHWVLLAEVRELAARRVLKLGYDEIVALGAGRPGPREWLGLSPVVGRVRVPGAAQAASYHAEVVLPPGVRAVTSTIVDASGGRLLDVDRDADRPALHTADPDLVDPVLLLELRAERSGVPVRGAAVAVVVAAQLAYAAFVASPPAEQAGPATSVVLAGSAIFAGVLAGTGEHQLVRRLFLGPRSLLALVAVVALAAATVRALEDRPEVVEAVWAGAAVVCALLAGTLVAGAVAAAPAVRTGRQDPPRTADHDRR